MPADGRSASVEQPSNIVIFLAMENLHLPCVQFLLHLLLCFHVVVASAIWGTGNNDSDRLALLSVKASVADDPTGALSSWNGSFHHCKWTGVACSRRQHSARVVALDLHSLGLLGTISPSIGNLTFLREVDLSDNQLSGAIPQAVGRLRSLRNLNMSNNQLSGNIPTNLSRCSSLEVIILSRNQLAGEIPAELGFLPSLVVLWIDNNRLTGAIPPSLGNLSSHLFESLVLQYNGLSGSIPPQLGRLASLRDFLVGVNNLSGAVPAPLFNLSSIVNLAVTDNRLSGTIPSTIGLILFKLRFFGVGLNQFEGNIPSSLSNASSLTELDLGNNRFSGKVPANLGNLKELEFFSVHSNRLEAREPADWNFLTSLGNCTHLQSLLIQNNRLGGVLPNSIANLSTSLQQLQMSRNLIAGEIPMGIQNLRGLQELSMMANQLSGSIPSAIGRLQSLVKLKLVRNRLSGEIPTALGNLTRLSELSLTHNSLTGQIPRSLGRCRQLQFLQIFGNNLSGSIPGDLFTIFTLLFVDLSRNFLVGSLPMKGGRSNLAELYLSDNRLSGELPPMLGDYQSLEWISLDGNFFEGNIPQSPANLKGIQGIDLSLNNLSGEVPQFLGDLKFLEYLNLSFNNLEGEVPKNGVFANASIVSVVGNKRLCGGISTLQLPDCPPQTQSKKSSHSLKLVIPMATTGVCVFLLFCFIAAFKWMKRSRKGGPTMPTLEDRFKQISYHELFKATDGFSPSNLIGKGSFGSVYRGVLDGDNETVAVKALDLEQRGASQSFLAECEALQKIKHRNLVKIITCCSSIDFSGKEFKALVYQFMPNGSLEEWLHPEPGEGDVRTMDFIQRLNIAIDVASTLNYLHNYCHSPIVHRDLKPSNVLLDDDMTAHVGDFGLAWFVTPIASRDPKSTSSTIGIKGSIGYVAPEYGLGGPVSTSGDVYSFEILLLELFTAKKPVDDMFSNGLTLHTFVETALPEQAIDIVDQNLIPRVGRAEQPYNVQNSGPDFREGLKDFFILTMRIALLCSKESPRERVGMEDVILELQSIKDAYLAAARSAGL